MGIRIEPGKLDERKAAQLTQALRDVDRQSSFITFLDINGALASGQKPISLDAVWVRYTSNAVADTTDSVAHNLGRIPLGFFISAPNKAGSVYRSPTAWTSTAISLRASVASLVADLLLF